MNLLIGLMERGLLPDAVIRLGIRLLHRRRLRQEDHGGVEANREHQRQFFAELADGPLAVATDAANQQHYELPPEFFGEVLGPRRKYSCCLYSARVRDLAGAEELMLGETCRRAGVVDGMDLLELGCGWGALTLWMAENYPHARITAVSNSLLQRRYLEDCCHRLRLSNVRVITADMNHFSPEERFDRVVSVEMFEHMRNYRELLRRIHGWLKDDGRLFVHLFCHRELAYGFETEGSDNWMGRYFFTGGIMPSDQLLFYFNDHLAVADHWRVNGRHYQQTCEAWLRRMNERRERILSILAGTYGAKAPIWYQRWRVFFMGCAELFGTNNGNEWFVSHYLLRRM